MNTLKGTRRNELTSRGRLHPKCDVSRDELSAIDSSKTSVIGVGARSPKVLYKDFVQARKQRARR